MFYYVENRYGSAGYGCSRGYAMVVESSVEIEICYDQAYSLSGPYGREEAERIAKDDNIRHSAYAMRQEGWVTFRITPLYGGIPQTEEAYILMLHSTEDDREIEAYRTGWDCDNNPVMADEIL